MKRSHKILFLPNHIFPQENEMLFQFFYNILHANFPGQDYLMQRDQDNIQDYAEDNNLYKEY